MPTPHSQPLIFKTQRSATEITTSALLFCLADSALSLAYERSHTYSALGRQCAPQDEYVFTLNQYPPATQCIFAQLLDERHSKQLFTVVPLELMESVFLDRQVCGVVACRMRLGYTMCCKCCKSSSLHTNLSSRLVHSSNPSH